MAAKPKFRAKIGKAISVPAIKPNMKPKAAKPSKGPSASAMQHANANASFKRSVAPGVAKPAMAPKPVVSKSSAPAFGAAGGGAGNFGRKSRSY